MVDLSKTQVFAHETKVKMDSTDLVAVSESLASHPEYYTPESGMIGTRHPKKARRFMTKNDVNGDITFEPTYANFEVILAAVMDEAAGTFTPAATPETKTAEFVIDRKGDIYTYANCVFNSLTIAGSENEPLQTVLNLLGTTEADAGAVGDATGDTPIAMIDTSFTIGADAIFPRGFSLVMAQNFESRFHNSVTRSSVQGGVYKVTGSLMLDLNSDMWTTLFANMNSNAAVAFGMVFSDGVTTFTVTIPEIVLPGETPTITGEGVVTYDMAWEAFLKQGETDVIEIVKS